MQNKKSNYEKRREELEKQKAQASAKKKPEGEEEKEIIKFELEGDFKAFEVGGVKFFVEDTLSVSRFREFEKLQIEVGFGRDFAEIFAGFSKIYEALQKGKVADAAVICSNYLEGVKGPLAGRANPVLRLCALFINTEGENKKTYDERDTIKKIDIWEKAGVDMSFFFSLAITLIPGFMKAYKESLVNISAA